MEIIKWYFLFHLVFVLLLFLLRAVKALRCGFLELVLALFLPIWGPAILLLKANSDRNQDREKSEIEIARMHVDDIMKSVNIDDSETNVVPLNEALIVNDKGLRRSIMKDILYEVNNSIELDSDDVMDQVVPLSEALVLNDSATRRALIMDVLYTDPSDYISQLSQAKNNDDTEVVHYAVTALVELQKEFDVKFHELFLKREQNPEDESLDKEYMRLLERYISCGLLEGDGLTTQLKKYRELLHKEMKKEEESWILRCKLADTNLKLKDADALSEDVAEMLRIWPERESTYFYRLKLGIITKNAAMIQGVIAEIQEKELYLSSELRDSVQFWSK